MGRRTHVPAGISLSVDHVRYPVIERRRLLRRREPARVPA
jgi:hypothetical protein